MKRLRGWILRFLSDLLHSRDAKVSGDLSAVAVFVDYDNAVLRAREAGFTLSFAKLRRLVGDRFGRIVFPKVFVSIRSFHPKAARILHDADFELVLCPLGVKDKDMVDTRMRSAIRRYAEHSSVSTIVVVSEDGDLVRNPELAHFVFDLGKRFEAIRVSNLRSELEGDDDEEGAPVVEQTRRKHELGIAIDRYGRDVRGETPGEQQDDDFVRDLMILLVDLFKNPPNRVAKTPTFHYLKKLLLERFRIHSSVWGESVYPGADLDRVMEDAIGALIGEEALLTKNGSNLTFYRPNSSHPAVARADEEAISLSANGTLS